MRSYRGGGPWSLIPEKADDHDGNNPTNPHQGAGRSRTPLPLCCVPSGTPCQRKPPGDHLARYLDAYTAGQLTRECLAAVLGELVIIARWRIVPDGAR
jgi:hypothetical protein